MQFISHRFHLFSFSILLKALKCKTLSTYCQSCLESMIDYQPPSIFGCVCRTIKYVGHKLSILPYPVHLSQVSDCAVHTKSLMLDRSERPITAEIRKCSVLCPEWIKWWSKTTLIYNKSSQNCINCVKKHQLVVVICYEWWLNWQEWWLQKATTDQCGHIPEC